MLRSRGSHGPVWHRSMDQHHGHCVESGFMQTFLSQKVTLFQHMLLNQTVLKHQHGRLNPESGAKGDFLFVGGEVNAPMDTEGRSFSSRRSCMP